MTEMGAIVGGGYVGDERVEGVELEDETSPPIS